MMLTTWDPFRTVADFDRAARGVRVPSAWAPAANLAKDESGYVLRLDVPGVEKDQINIDVERNVLVVSGERSSFTETAKDEEHYKVESFSGSFRRSFRLPDDADVAAISATHKDGVLTVRVPRAESARARKVEIAAA